MPYVEAPMLLPLNLVDKNRDLPANYHQRHFDGWTATEQITTYEAHKCDIQKWQKNDICFLQIRADFSPLRIRVRDMKGRIVLSQLMSIVATINNDIYFQDQVAFDDPVFEEGFYILEVLAGDPILIVLQSSLLHIKEQHYDTLLIKYSNSFNNQILWETGIYMTIRIDGRIMYDRPSSVRTVYVDQPGAGVTVKGDPFRIFRLYAGIEGGQQNWVIDKLEGIIDQNYVEYDGKGFVPLPGASWNTNKLERYPWQQWNIEMRETSNRRIKRFEVDGIQDRKVAIDYNVSLKLFGPIDGSSNDNSVTINSVE